MTQKIILDTDIGDDIDDALAMGLICASPEIDLVGVTTVFGNVDARNRQARTILKIAGERFGAIPVASGCGASMASRPLGNTADYLRGSLPNQDGASLPECELPPASLAHGVDFLIDTIMGGDEDIVPVTIGAMTNLAMALVKEPRIAAKIPLIVAMAGEFRLNYIEWNIRCDPEAARIVFSSGIPMQITPWIIGDIATFDEVDIEKLNSSGGPLGLHLAKTIAAWRSVEKRMPSLYDPHAIATMIDPSLATWKQGRVHVELGGERSYSATRFDEDATGPHRVAWDTDRGASIAFYLERILQATN